MSPDSLRNAVADEFGVGPESLHPEVRARTKLLVSARRVLTILLLRTGRSLHEVGVIMSRDHTSVLYSRDTASKSEKAKADKLWRMEEKRKEIAEELFR